MACREKAALISINRLSGQFVGLSKMRLTVMDNIIFHDAWSGPCTWEFPVPCAKSGLTLASWMYSSALGRWISMETPAVAAAMLAGDGWRTRHDFIKWLIAQQASWAMYHMRVETNNLFLPWINQRDDFMRDQKARKRQGLILDFQDVQRQVIMDVKGCSYCPTRYNTTHFRDVKNVMQSWSDKGR